MKATAIAHPNIALVKYWGKRDAALNLPATDSLSLTLAPVRSRTTVSFDASPGADRFTLNGVEQAVGELTKLTRFLARVRSRVVASGGVSPGAATVVSDNDFPTAAGLASSSSGLAALALAATRAAGLSLPPSELSSLARMGSGSAARSVFGGYVRMHRGARADGTDAVAEPIAGPDHWDLRVVIAVTTEKSKDAPSTDGMNHTVATSPYFDAWVNAVPGQIAEATEAIGARDFERLAKVAEASAMQMHASAIAADPAVLYWNGTTVEVIHAVRAMRRTGVPVFFTIDAGPHVKVFTPGGWERRVAALLEGIPGVLRTIGTWPGPGAQVVDG